MGTIENGTGLSWKRLAVVLATLSLLLAACGGGGDDGKDDEGAGKPGDAAEQGDGKADPAGVIRVGYDLVSPAKGGFRWDPATQATSQTDSGVFALVYGSLLRRTSAGELEPDLAESSEVVDPNTIELKLREGLTFSDGTPFDAAAVKAGLERNLKQGNPAGFSNIFFSLKAVEAVDDTTVRLSIPDGTAASWHDTFLGSWETTISHPSADFTKPIGAGPMVVESFTPETRIVMKKNEKYWDAKSILPGGLEFINVPAQSETAGPSALKAGQVDMVTIATTQMKALGDGYDVLLEVSPTALVHLAACKRDEPLSDPKVRKALNKALDRELISKAVFDDAFVPALGIWPKGHRFHDPSVEDAVAFDLPAAKKLMKEAGYEDGFDLDIYVLNAGGMPQLAQVLQQIYAEINVTLNIVPAPNIVSDYLVAQKPGLAALPTMGGGRGKLRSWTGDAVGNVCKWNDPELNELQTQLTKVSDASDEAEEIWHKIEQKVVAEDTLSIVILFGATPIAYNTDLGDPAVTPDQIAVPDVRRTFVKAD